MSYHPCVSGWSEPTVPPPAAECLRGEELHLIQFARRPPKFRGIRFTSVKPADAPVLHAEIAVLLAKDAIEPVPPADMRSGLFSPDFIVPSKGGGLRPILDLRVLNRALHKLPFKMLTQKRIFGCVRPLDWFAAIDLKDAYFHVSILPRHRPFLRFAFEGQGQAYQYKVLPFGLSLSPRVFTKVVEAALVPLREQGVRILNYLDDWLILAQSRRQLFAHRDLVLKHLSLLGLRVNWEKSKLVLTQRISFLGMEFDSVNQTARLTQERAQSVLNCIKTFRPWSDPSFLRAGVPLEQVSRHAVVFTDASTTDWGATYNGHAVSGVWTGPQLHWHINCLELLAVRLALSRLRGRLQCKDVLVRTDNTATVAYINRQGGFRSRRMSQLARHLPSCHPHPRSVQSGSRRAVSSSTSRRVETPSPGGSADLGTVRSCSGRPVCISRNHPLPRVLLPNRGNARHGCTGTQLAPGPAQICVPPSEPTSTDTVQDQGGRGAGLVSGSILAQQDLVPETHAPRDSPSLANSSEEGSAFSETGHPMAPYGRF